MKLHRGKIAVLLLAAACLAGCASDGRDDADNSPPMPIASALPQESGHSSVSSQPGQQALQCAPYVRAHSQVKLFGDAATWWTQATGKYERGSQPTAGAVMVLHNYSGSDHGHVAVVRRVVSPREIRIDHANWLNDGSIYVNDPVVDVSAANDWSVVKVWNIKAGGWGAKIFPVQGFIGAGASPADTQMVEVRSEIEAQGTGQANLVWDQGREVALQKAGRLPDESAPPSRLAKDQRSGGGKRS